VCEDMGDTFKMVSTVLPTRSTGSGIARNIPPVDLWTTPRVEIFNCVCDMGLVEIDATDHLMAEQHLALRIGLGHRAQGDGQTVQRLADAKGVAAVADPSSGADHADFKAGWIVDGRQRFRKRDRARAITAGGSGQVQRVVRAAQIAAVAETIELALAVLERSEIEVAQDLELKRAMKALVLAWVCGWYGRL